MRAKGINPSLLKVIQLGDSPVRMQAIRAGIVDVIAIGPPQDLMLKREGYAILAGPQDVEIALPTSGLAATSRMLQENHSWSKGHDARCSRRTNSSLKTSQRQCKL